MGPHRVNIINVLQLIASAIDQLEYQSKSPVNVATEVVNQWFDDFYHPGSPEFEIEFSRSELSLLTEFNRVYEERVALLPDTLPELLASVAWSEVMSAANSVLVVCGWEALKVAYER